MGEPFSVSLLPERWQELDFAPFREGIEISWLRPDLRQLALLRYAPGASVPWHRHTGLETVLVLEGSQSDDRGDYPRGSLVVNPPGSAHRVWSDRGCLVLLHWEAPVEFLEPE